MSCSMTQKQSLEVRFVADEDVLDHIVEKQQGNLNVFMILRDVY